MELSAVDNIFITQPCRDNTLYLLRLVDEMLISEIDQNLPVLDLAAISICDFSFSLKNLLLERRKSRRAKG